MKKALIILVVIVGLLVGCHPEENPEQLKAVNENLERTNSAILDANKLIYEELIEKQKDPQTHYQAEEWNPRANRIQQCSKNLKVFIENIKVDLVSQSDSLKKDYVELTKQLHNTDGVGQQLLNKLIDFKDSLSTTIYSDKDSIHQASKDDLNHLLKTIPLLPGYGESLSADQRRDYKKEWLEKNFGRSSSLMAMIILNKIESDVLLSEKEFITYYNYRVAVFCGMGVRMFSAVAVLSSSYVKAGQPIEVTTGVGSFSDAAKPRITINGKEVKTGTDATAEYKFIATGKPGKYIIPITIEFYKPDGTRERVTKNLKYIIAD